MIRDISFLNNGLKVFAYLYLSDSPEASPAPAASTVSAASAVSAASTVSAASAAQTSAVSAAPAVFPAPAASSPVHAVSLLPVVILCHGFNGSCEHSIPYAEKFLAAGFAAVIFDFCGGAMVSRSGGSMQQMSVMTELSDLQAVITQVKSQPEIDGSRIFLFGRSQGGLVSAMAAAQDPSVSGLLLLYPAFSIPGQARDMFPDHSDVPDKLEFLGAVIGRRYYEDVTAVDPVKIQKAYSGPVLILQGQKDTTVPPETAEIAVKNYADARLIRLPNAGHGFSGEDFELAARECVRFAKELCSRYH